MGAKQPDLAFWQQPAGRCYRLDAQQQPELPLRASMQGWLSWLTWMRTSPAAVFPSMGSFRQRGMTLAARELWGGRQSSASPGPEPCASEVSRGWDLWADTRAVLVLCSRSAAVSGFSPTTSASPLCHEAVLQNVILLF